MARRRATSPDGRRGPWRRLTSADRTFAVLVAVASLPVVLVAVAGCSVLGYVAYRLSTDGLSAMSGTEDLRPAVGFVALFVLGIGLGVRALLAQLAATRRLSRAVEDASVPTPGRLQPLVDRCGLRRRVVVVAAEEPFSFAYGLGSPRVVVSTGLLDALNDDEALAVLEHERYHVRVGDPLKVVTARALTATFFYLPVLRPLRARYVARRELAADRCAVLAAGRTALAGALYRAVAAPRWADVGGAAAIGGAAALEDRVTHLETGREPPPPALSRFTVAATVMVVALLVGALGYTVVEVGGPEGLMRGRMDDEMEMTSPAFADVLLFAAPWLAVAAWLWHESRHRRG